MSEPLRQAAEQAAGALERIARDVRRPRPADWSQAEADERTAQLLERIAAELRQALRVEES